MSCLLPSTTWLVCLLTVPGADKAPATVVADPAGILREISAPAQPGSSVGASGREFFISWGYNGDAYAKSDIHFSQPSLGNEFTLAGVQARDSKGWTDLFNHSLFVPQYNIRIGMFFNDRWGIELAHDHMKWIVRQDQDVRMTGTLNGEPVDTTVTLTPDVLRYQLNNGANPLFINLIRRFRVLREPRQFGHVSLLAKAGGGFANPHTENTVFGQPNEKGFQFFQGWNVDAAAAVRVDILKGLYFELEEKIFYARYFGIEIHEGTARHSVKANEFSWNFGWAFR